MYMNIQGRHANTYINICTIKSVLVNNTGKMQTHPHTQTNTKQNTSILVHVPMQAIPTPPLARVSETE